MMLVLLLQVIDFVLKVLKSHQSSEGLGEIQNFFRSLVRQPGARDPDVFGHLTQNGEEDLEVLDAPYLALLVL